MIVKKTDWILRQTVLVQCSFIIEECQGKRRQRHGDIVFEGQKLADNRECRWKRGEEVEKPRGV